MTTSIAAEPSATAPLGASLLAPVASGSGAEPGAPATERRKRGRPRDPEADGRILEAAAALILVRGFDNMTVDDVAARARVGKATVYRRWAKKEDLAVAAMHRLYDAEMPVPDTGSLREDLRVGYTSALTFATSEHGAAYLRTAVAESSRDPRIAALYGAANARATSGTRQMFERGILRGEVRADMNIGAAVDFLTGILLVRTVTGVAMPTLEEVDSLVDLVLRGAEV